MSKAFTKESDVEIAEPPVTRVAELLPAGAKNYVTADGARRMREELSLLMSPGTAAPDQRQREQRMRDLQEVLRTAEVIDPVDGDAGVVRFGAFVTVKDAEGEVDEYRIVGVHETDLRRGWVSWLSPMAQALVNARVGDRVRLEVPAGEMLLEILDVRYPDR
jgi:transcription elongation factor GreB